MRSLPFDIFCVRKARFGGTGAGQNLKWSDGVWSLLDARTSRAGASTPSATGDRGAARAVLTASTVGATLRGPASTSRA